VFLDIAAAVCGDAGREKENVTSCGAISRHL